MQGLVFVLMVFLAFGVLGAFALTLGVDSREDSFDDRAPAGGLTT